jgi:hypothetical protein
MGSKRLLSTSIARPVRRAGGGLGGTMDDWRTFQSLLVSRKLDWPGKAMKGRQKRRTYAALDSRSKTCPSFSFPSGNPASFRSII